MDHAYGRRGGFTLGLEEELLLVDSETRALAHVAERVLPALDLPEGAAAHEAYACEIELRSPPSERVREAAEALARAREAARAAAGTAGSQLIGAGVHPDAEGGDVEFVDAERYRVVQREMRGLIRRTPECALHVHVGMPDPESAIRAFNGLRTHLPLLQALSANSPWSFGLDSGLASARYALVRAYPGRGVPPAFQDFDHYAEAVGAEAAAAGVDDYTMLWWDVRPHPRFGTVELREMDAQSRLADVAALGALVQALAAYESERRGPWPEPAALAWSTFRAARDGLDATILDDGAMTPVRAAVERTLERIRPQARELGADAALEGIERILREGGGAARRRAAHRRGGKKAMLEELMEETAAGPPASSILEIR